MTKGVTILYYLWLIVGGLVYHYSDKGQKIENLIILLLMAILHILCVIASEVEKSNKQKQV